MEEMRQSLSSGCSTLSSEVWLWASCICLQLFLTEVRTRRTVRCAAHAARAARAAVVYQRTNSDRSRSRRSSWSSAGPTALSAFRPVPPSSIAFSEPGPGGKRVLGIESIVEFALSRPRCDRPNIYRVPRCSTPAPDPWWRRCLSLAPPQHNAIVPHMPQIYAEIYARERPTRMQPINIILDK